MAFFATLIVPSRFTFTYLVAAFIQSGTQLSILLKGQRVILASWDLNSELASQYLRALTTEPLL